MNFKAYALFIVLFLAVGYGMSLASPSLPNLGSPSANWLESGGITAFVLLFAWEKWLRKDAVKKEG